MSRAGALSLAASLLAATGCPHPRPAAPVVAPLPAGAYAHYLRGRVAAFEGDFALAAEELRTAAAAAPDEPRIEVERVRALAKAGRKRDAQAAVTTAEARWPASADGRPAGGEPPRARRA